MPNWCSNYLQIFGDAKSIAKIKLKLDSMKKCVRNEEYVIVEKGDLLFQTLIGLGLEEAGITRKEYDDGAWYDHNCSRFGTKWDIHDEYYEVIDDGDDESVTLTITTAWSPCIPFAEKLSKKYNVSIDMNSEEGNYWFVEIRNGEVTSFQEYEYEEGNYLHNSDHFWEGIVENLIEEAVSEYDDINEAIAEIREQLKFIDKKDMKEVLRLLKEAFKEEHEKNWDA